MPKLDKDIWPGSKSLGVWRPSGLRGLDGSLLQKISLTTSPGKRYSVSLGQCWWLKWAEQKTTAIEFMGQSSHTTQCLGVGWSWGLHFFKRALLVGLVSFGGRSLSLHNAGCRGSWDQQQPARAGHA